MSRIVIVTTGQLSTNPRMLKEVDAIQKRGHEVKVLYSYWTDWAVKADKNLLKEYPDIFQQVGGDPLKDKLTYFFSRLLHKFARQAGRYISGLQYYSIARNTYFLERAACGEKADLYIGHNLGSLPAVVQAAKKWKAKCGFDAEDYHRGQFEKPSGPAYKYTVATEEKFMPACDYLTAASPLIAAAYKHILPARDIVVINNVFSKKWIQPLPEVNMGPLRLFWFSQTVGRDRGLELIIKAINLLPACTITLDLMGDCPENFRKYLEDMATKPATLHFLPPVPADELFAVAASYDIGMAAEIPHSENRDICLTNKLFTYLLAGNCILASDTKAQRLFMENNPGTGFLYRNDNPDDLAARLENLYNDRAGLRQCRQRSLTLATEKYNWESESAIFLNLIVSVLEEK